MNWIILNLLTSNFHAYPNLAIVGVAYVLDLIFFNFPPQLIKHYILSLG